MANEIQQKKKNLKLLSNAPLIICKIVLIPSPLAVFDGGSDFQKVEDFSQGNYHY